MINKIIIISSIIDDKTKEVKHDSLEELNNLLASDDWFIKDIKAHNNNACSIFILEKHNKTT